jgi:hypothetical protein
MLGKHFSIFKDNRISRYGECEGSPNSTANRAFAFVIVFNFPMIIEVFLLDIIDLEVKVIRAFG